MAAHEIELEANDADCDVFTIDGELWLRCDICRTVRHDSDIVTVTTSDSNHHYCKGTHG